MEDYIFYDIEVFKHDYLVVFKDIHSNVLAIYHNSANIPLSGKHAGSHRGSILDLIAPRRGYPRVRKPRTLVAYNNYFYDDHILTGILAGWSPEQIKGLNDTLITSHKSPHKISPYIHSLDCFQQIDVQRPSLKKIEANMGIGIEETAVDFNIDRPLTPEELESTIFYCAYDVDATIRVFEMRKSNYFTPKQGVVEMLPKHIQSYAHRWNDTTLAAMAVKGQEKRKLYWRDIKLHEPHQLPENNPFEKRKHLVPKRAIKVWMENRDQVPDYKGKPKSYTHKDFEPACNIEFALGGLHGVPVHNKVRYEKVHLLDVASLYPNVMIYLEAIGAKPTEKYAEIVAHRLRVKHTHADLQAALKLIINSCYGLMKSEYSVLYNPNAALSVCVFGQILLYDLCTRLDAAGCEIVNINTDGVAFQTPDDRYKEIWKQWEEDYSTDKVSFKLEEEYYDLFIQKDVNNYIAVQHKGYKKHGTKLFVHDGYIDPADRHLCKIKLKGGDVGRYQKDAFFRNNSLRIVDVALVEKILFNIDPLDTIEKHLQNPDSRRLFQMILSTTSKYKGTVDVNRNVYQKVNRIFATNRKDAILLYKLRHDDGLVRFPNSPEKMHVWNRDLSEMNHFEDVIDVGFYYNLIVNTLERWS